MRWAGCAVIVVLAACGRIDYDVIGDGDGGGGGSAFRRSITIVNPSSSELSRGHTIRVGLGGGDLDAAVAPSRGDVRVVPNNAGASSAGLDRTFDLAVPGQDQALWFALDTALPSMESITYWLYYGDDSLSPPSDARKIFPLFPEFDAPTLHNSWSTLGTVAVGGSLQLGTGDNAIASDYMNDSIGTTAVFEARMSAANVDDGNAYYWIGFQHQNDFGTGDPFLNWVGEPSIIHAWVNVAAASDRCTDMAADEMPHWYRIERGPTVTRFYRDGVMACEVSVVDATDYSVQLRNQSSVASISVDWVRVRALATPEPEVTVGPEEAI